MNSTIAVQPAARPRVNYIDWLRIMAVLLLIPFHTARLFDSFEDFYVKNADTSMGFSAFIGFVFAWHMPLMFVLAGAGSWFALGFRNPFEYLFERCKRLIIPLAFGVLVVVPPQMFFAQRFHSQYAGSYLDFYPGFFVSVPGSDYPGLGFSYAHLWFILFLFVMSVVALPLFVFLRAKWGARLTGVVAAILGRRWTILLLALPLPFTAALEDPMGHNFGLYLILFVYGYWLMADPRFQAAIHKARWTGVVLGLIATAIFFASVIVWGTDGEEEDLPSVVFQLSMNSATWFWIVAILGFGQRWLTAGGKVLRYANEAAYPFYIIHQTAIVVIGYYVVQWPVDALVKFVVVMVAAFVTTLGIYEVLVRRIGILRVLFGMKLAPSAPRSLPRLAQEA